MQTVLGRQLMTARISWISMLGSTLNVFTDIERTVAGMLVPPGDERLIVCRLVANFPIQLRRYIIDSAFFEPFQDVGI